MLKYIKYVNATINKLFEPFSLIRRLNVKSIANFLTKFSDIMTLLFNQHLLTRANGHNFN